MAETVIKSKALFGDGYGQVDRLGKLQDEINNVRVNPKAFNLEKNCYNYEIWFNNLCSLYSEIGGKLDKDEIKVLNYQKDNILLALEVKPVHTTIKNHANGTQSTRTNESNWKLIRKMLEIFEKEVRKKMDEHGLGNPDSLGESLF